MRHKKTVEENGKKKERKHRRTESGHHSREAWELMKRLYDYTCPCCGRREPEIVLTRDHITPVKKNGTSFIENIQPLCERCNSEKGTTIAYYPLHIVLSDRAIYS
jgi:5-methylcytosine-specific restriction endonuclease McrA